MQNSHPHQHHHHHLPYQQRQQGTTANPNVILKEDLNLTKLPYLLLVCKVNKADLVQCAHPIMEIILFNSENRFFSYCESQDEITIIVDEFTLQKFPSLAILRSPDKYWGLEISGPLGASAIGIIHSVAEPLASAGISIFYLSTYQTDYTLIAEKDFGKSLSCLSQHFHLQTANLEEPINDCFQFPNHTTPKNSEARRKLCIHLGQSLCLASFDKTEPFLLGAFLLQLIFFADKGNDRFFSYHETNGVISMILSKSELSTLLFVIEEANNSASIRVYDNQFARIEIVDKDLGFDEYGVVDSIAAPLTNNNIPLFYISTYNSAHVLVAMSSNDNAQKALKDKFDVVIK